MNLMYRPALAVTSLIAFCAITPGSSCGTAEAQTRGLRRSAIAASPKSSPAEARIIENLKALKAETEQGQVTPAAYLEVVPARDAKGAERERQSIAGSLIERQSEEARYSPVERLRHYNWIKNDDVPPLRGWKGEIRDLSATPDGLRVRVRVRVWPVFADNFTTSAYTDETFVIAGGIVIPASIEHSDLSGPRVITRP